MGQGDGVRGPGAVDVGCAGQARSGGGVGADGAEVVDARDFDERWGGQGGHFGRRKITQAA